MDSGRAWKVASARLAEEPAALRGRGASRVPSPPEGFCTVWEVFVFFIFVLKMIVMPVH